MAANPTFDRISRLKEQIADLDIKIQLTSTEPQRPKYEFMPLQRVPEGKEQNDKERERSQLASQIDEMSQNIECREEAAKNELFNCESELKNIQIHQKQEKRNAKLARESLTVDISEKKDKMRDIQDEYDNAAGKLDYVKRIVQEEHAHKMRKIDQELSPVEEQAREIQKQANEVRDENQIYEDHISAMREQFYMTREEIDSKTLQRAEYVAQREELDEIYEEFKRKYGPEFSGFIQEMENKQELITIREKKETQIEKIKNVGLEITDLTHRYQQEYTRLQQLQNEIDRVFNSTPNKDTQAEIEKLETYIRIRCGDMATETLDDVILDLNADTGFDIDEEILTFQLQEIESREVLLMEEWKGEEEHLQDQINRIQHEIEEKESQKITENDTEIEYYIHELMLKISEARGKFKSMKRTNKQRLAAITQWKNEAIAALEETTPSQGCTIEDGQITEEFMARVVRTFMDNDKRGTLENVLTMYLSKLQQREKFLQQCHVHVGKQKSEQVKIERELKQMQMQKKQYEQQKADFRKDLMRLVMSEKTLLKENENQREGTNAIKISEEALDDFLHSKSSDFTRMLKTHGIKAAERVKQTERQRFEESLTAQYKKRRAKLQDLFNEIDLWEKRIEQNAVLTEKTLMPQLTSTQKAFNEKMVVFSLADDKLTEAQDAEEAINKQIEYLLNRKRQAMYETMKKIQEGSAGLADETHLQALKDKLKGILAELNELETELQVIDEEFYEKTSVYEVEETKVRSHMHAIQEQMIEIEQEKAKLARLNKRHRVLERDLRSRGGVDMNLIKEIVDEPVKPLTTTYTDKYAEKLGSSFCTSGQDQYSSDEEGSPNISMEQQMTERQFFEKVAPLLDGAVLYKKFSQRTVLKYAAFDPLESQPPESYGFGIRNFKLNRDLKQIEIRQVMKSVIDSQIIVENISGLLVPTQTMNIIRIQKRSPSSLDESPSKTYAEMKEAGFIQKDSADFIRRCRDSQYYPFSIVLSQGGRIEIVAKSYATFKQWTGGINALVKFKKHLPRMTKKNTFR